MVMRYTWLADVLRRAGLTVHEVSGWKTRGADSYGPVRGITCHHTAGSKNSTDAGEIKVLLNGSSSAPPPIAQLYLSRSGDWHVIAAGLCYHNKIGRGGPNEGYGNDALLGIEAQHSGAGESWTSTQYDSYVRGVAALVRHQASGWNVTVGRVAGHKEHQPGAKSDPTFDMAAFRRAVAAEIELQKEEEDMPSASEIAKAVWDTDMVDPNTDQVKNASTFLRYSDSLHVNTRAVILKELQDIEKATQQITELAGRVSALQEQVGQILAKLEQPNG